MHFLVYYFKIIKADPNENPYPHLLEGGKDG